MCIIIKKDFHVICCWIFDPFTSFGMLIKGKMNLLTLPTWGGGTESSIIESFWHINYTSLVHIKKSQNEVWIYIIQHYHSNILNKYSFLSIFINLFTPTFQLKNPEKADFRGILIATFSYIFFLLKQSFQLFLTHYFGITHM